MRRALPICASLFFFANVAFAENWPGWRGPDGMGHSAEKNPPLTWSQKENVRWKIELPDTGNATPAVWKDRIFITQATNKGTKRGVICVNRKDGTILWQKYVDFTGQEPTHDTNPYGSASPATDGERVVASCGYNGAREKIALPVNAIVKISENLDFDRAAGIIITYGTALHALEDRARSIFLAALERGSDHWPAFLDAACGDTAELRARVEQFLHAHLAIGSIHGTAVATADELLGFDGPGTVVGSYKLLEQIGEGGFGVVFMAEQTQPVRRKVALKILKPGMDTRQVVARFEAERQALAIMDHTCIAKVLDAGTTDAGRLYFIMELVKGVPITKYCDELNLPIRERLALFERGHVLTLEVFDLLRLGGLVVRKLADGDGACFNTDFPQRHQTAVAANDFILSLRLSEGSHE